MNKKELYEIIEKNKQNERYKNLIELKKNINSKDLEHKIQNHLLKNSYLSYTVEQIKQMILSSDFIASFFIKEPNKQNYTEKLVLKLLQSIFPNAEKLKKHIYLWNNGTIKNISHVGGIKSIDYMWTYNGYTFLATQKYSNTEKFSKRDYMKNEIDNFINYAHYNNDKDIVFVALLDGAFFNDEVINSLKENIDKKRKVIACSITELEYKVKGLFS